ncbi:MAG: hypothetical protein O3A14_08955 [Cyanobacteria bacterium]|nr:hypothetical protein [Cyanobacteriota bacterium]
MSRTGRFQYTAIRLYGSEETLCIVADAADWQAGLLGGGRSGLAL